MDCLGDTNPTDILNIVRPQVESHGAGRLVLRQQRCQVQAVTALPYWLGEAYGHILPLPLIHLESLMKMRRTTYCIIYQRARSFWPIHQL